METRFVCALLVCGACAIDSRDSGIDELAETEQDIYGGTVATPGQYEAVAAIMAPFGPKCTATLINKEFALTAAHCVCRGYPLCDTTATLRFPSVVPADGGARRDITLSAKVAIYPGWSNTFDNDYAYLRLERPADRDMQVAPIPVSSSVPARATWQTLVGFGMSGAEGAGCVDPIDGQKRYMSTALDGYISASGQTRLKYVDSTRNTCSGDSGGPSIYRGKVVGVLTGGLTTVSEYGSTASAWNWLAANACPTFEKEFPDASFCSDPMCPCTAGEGSCASDAQCKSGHSCLDNVGEANGWAWTDNLCWHDEHVVTVYEHAPFAGVSAKLPVGTWKSHVLLSNNVHDNISSLKIPEAYAARLWEHGDCTGRSQTYEGDVYAVDDSMNDITSCIEVLPGVKVWTGQSTSGLARTFTEGAYNHVQLTGFFDNGIESLSVAPGMVVRACTDSGYPGTTGNGTCNLYWGYAHTLGSMNNSISNLEVKSGVWAYEHDDFEGNWQGFPPGVYNGADLYWVGNDKISSLVVGPGMKATLCEHDNGGGTCKTYIGRNSQMGFVGADRYRVWMNDKTSYIHVRRIEEP